MKTLELNCYGITIQNADDIAQASISSSEMYREQYACNETFNSAVNMLLETVLNHHKAGLDIQSPAYLEGVESTYQTISDTHCKTDILDDEIVLTRTRTVECTGIETVEYKVNKSDWIEALSNAENEEEALENLLCSGVVTRLIDETESTEVHESFSVEIEVG